MGEHVPVRVAGGTRRLRAALIATACAGLACAGLAATAGSAVAGTPSVAAASARTAVAAAQRTIALGADTKHSPGQTAEGEASVAHVESQLGRKIAFTRDFLLWDSAFPTAFENWLGARGTTLMLSVKSRLANGTAVPWSAVAAAQPGSALYSQILGWANRLKAYGYPTYFTFSHEPEAVTNTDLGSAADYIAAWRHVHDIFIADGVTNVRFMWIMTDYSFRVPSSDRRSAPKWYPGDAYVDGIAADAYNWSNCRYANGPWESLATGIAGFVAFGAQHPGVPLWLTEFASTENPTNASAKPGWISAAETMLQQPAYAQIVGVSYFDQSQGGMPNCTWPVDSSAASTAAFAAMAQDPYFQGSASFSGGSPPPPPSSVSFVAGTSTTANATSETVTVPAAAGTGTALLLIATSATPTLPSAPSGWTLVSSRVSATMASAVWQRVAPAGFAGTSVRVGFGVMTKGSVELLDYAGADPSGPVRSASSTAVESSAPVLTAPPSADLPDGGLSVAYWAVRSSVETSLTPAAGVTERSSETNTAGGRITSASADGPAAAGGVPATVTPAAAHAIIWTIELAPTP